MFVRNSKCSFAPHYWEYSYVNTVRELICLNIVKYQQEICSLRELISIMMHPKLLGLIPPYLQNRMSVMMYCSFSVIRNLFKNVILFHHLFAL